MEAMTVVQQAATPQGGLRQRWNAQAGAMGGDAFALLFLQLIGEGAGQTGLLEQPPGDGEALDQAQENGGLVAAALLAAMNGGVPVGPVVQGAPSETAAVPAGGMPQAVAADPLRQAQLLPEQTPQGEQPLQQRTAGQAFYTVLKTAWGEEGAPQPTQNAGLEAGSAFRLAKQLLSQQDPQPAAIPVDIDRLQADVSAGRFLPSEAAGQQQGLPTPSLEEITRQLKTGILDQAARGNNEFIVRLEPEGIGEIVVKLSENRERIALSIFTANAQTAKLVSNEVAALQNALRPFHAEVQQVVYTPSPSEQAASYASQGDLAGQNQQAFEQQYFNQQRQRRPYPDGWEREEEGFDLSIQQALGEDALDTYI